MVYFGPGLVFCGTAAIGPLLHGSLSQPKVTFLSEQAAAAKSCLAQLVCFTCLCVILEDGPVISAWSQVFELVTMQRSQVFSNVLVFIAPALHAHMMHPQAPALVSVFDLDLRLVGPEAKLLLNLKP